MTESWQQGILLVDEIPDGARVTIGLSHESLGSTQYTGTLKRFKDGRISLVGATSNGSKPCAIPLRRRGGKWNQFLVWISSEATRKASAGQQKAVPDTSSGVARG